MPEDKRGLLIVRAWVEEGSDHPLRAQLRYTADLETGFEREVTLADIDAVCETVRRWLERVQGDREGA